MKRGLSAVLALFALACHESAVSAGAGGSSEDSGSSSTGATSSGTMEPDASDSSSGTVPDLGDDRPVPPVRARIVLDVAKGSGHTLALHELKGGVPQPPVELLPETPSGATFTVTPLGEHDRLALDVTYGAGNHEIFLVDWSAGHPAAITSLALATTVAAVSWSERIDAAIVRTDNDFTRFDIGDGVAPRGTALLADLPFGFVFDDHAPLLPVGPTLALVGGMIGKELYLASVTDAAAPTVQVTELGPGARYPAEVGQLASGAVAFAVRNYEGTTPSAIHVVPPFAGGWGTTLPVLPPHDLPSELVGLRVQPHGDAFAYLAIPDDELEPPRLLLGRLEGERLAAPIELHRGATGHLEFAPDGSRLAYTTAPDRSIEVVELDAARVGAPREVYRADDDSPMGLSISDISPDGRWAFARVYDPEGLAQTIAVVRVDLDLGTSETIATDEHGSAPLLRIAYAPDGRSIAFDRQSTAGFVTHVVDCAADVCAAPALAERPDAPERGALTYSPDGTWLAIDGDSGGATSTALSIVRAEDPAAAVLRVDALRGHPTWLP